MIWNDMLNASALEQARAIRERSVSSEELVRLYLERIEALDPQLSAFVTTWPREALREARRKDAMVRSGAPLPTFHGVPIAIKDLNTVRGHWTRFGSRAIAVLSPADCKSTASLRRSGFVVLGKTATSELGAMPVTEPDIHPPTRNPWDPAVASGGSSGGAAVAVAVGMLPVAHGSDGGGSIRIPSALCHVFGIKPSRGRVPNAYGMEDRQILYSCGPITRTVADAAAMLDVLSGLDSGAPHWMAAHQPRIAELARDTPRPLRIRMMCESKVLSVDGSIQAAVRRAGAALAACGHHVEECGPIDGSIEEFLPIWAKLIASTPVFFRWRLQPTTRWLRERGHALRTADVRKAQDLLALRLMRAMEGADLWLTPTVAVPAPAVGAWRGAPIERVIEESGALCAFTAIANLTGQPAATVPAGLRDGRWPMGVQLVGRVGDDALVLAVSRLLEEALPWRGLWPAVARG